MKQKRVLSEEELTQIEKYDLSLAAEIVVKNTWQTESEPQKESNIVNIFMRMGYLAKLFAVAIISLSWIFYLVIKIDYLGGLYGIEILWGMQKVLLFTTYPTWIIVIGLFIGIVFFALSEKNTNSCIFSRMYLDSLLPIEKRTLLTTGLIVSMLSSGLFLNGYILLSCSILILSLILFIYRYRIRYLVKKKIRYVEQRYKDEKRSEKILNFTELLLENANCDEVTKSIIVKLLLEIDDLKEKNKNLLNQNESLQEENERLRGFL